jgi:magnesium chelatase family protein
MHLEECLEWSRQSIEVLRQPLDSAYLDFRAKGLTKIDFLLLATCNLCPCGQRGDVRGACVCTSYDIRRYFKRFSLALLDRIPLRMAMSDQDTQTKGASARQAAELVEQVRGLTIRRQGTLNAQTSSADLLHHIAWSADAIALLAYIKATKKYSLRGELQLQQVATTIADMDNKNEVGLAALQEAIFFNRNIFEESLSWPRARQALGKPLQISAFH